MTLETNGRGPGFRITLANLGYLSAIATLFSFFAGMYTGYTGFTARMNALDSRIDATIEQVKNLHAQSSSIGFRLNTLGDTIVADRQALTNRLTALETKLEFIRQDTAEIKLKAGTNR